MYRKMYTALFNAVTDALEDLKHGDVVSAMDRLVEAQQKTEEMFLNGEAGNGGEMEESRGPGAESLEIPGAS